MIINATLPLELSDLLLKRIHYVIVIALYGSGDQTKIHYGLMLSPVKIKPIIIIIIIIIKWRQR